MNPDVGSTRLSFGDFTLDCRSLELHLHGSRIKLQPQPAKLLVLLATRAGQVVTRSEIEAALWTKDTFVDFEHGINFAISQIRDALEDDADMPRYLETVPRVGYRFIAPVEKKKPNGQEPERSPYPGLASFSSEDSSFFFGREEEVESLWRKLRHRSLSALIGPSGAGKTSLLHAGLVPARPTGWEVLVFRPRGNALSALRATLAGSVSEPIGSSHPMDRLGGWPGDPIVAYAGSEGKAAAFDTHRAPSRATSRLDERRSRRRPSLLPLPTRARPFLRLEESFLRSTLKISLNSIPYHRVDRETRRRSSDSLPCDCSSRRGCVTSRRAKARARLHREFFIPVPADPD